jgi:hypothetical protein
VVFVSVSICSELGGVQCARKTKYRGHHDVLFAAAREAGLEMMRLSFRIRSWPEAVFMATLSSGRSDKHR